MGTHSGHDWYLADWLAMLDLKQARLCDRTGWDKRKVSDLVGGNQRYNRDTLNEAADALNIAPFELLLHPTDAMAMRRFRETARLVAAEPALTYESTPDTLESLLDSMKKTGSKKS